MLCDKLLHFSMWYAFAASRPASDPGHARHVTGSMITARPSLAWARSHSGMNYAEVGLRTTINAYV